MRLLKSQSLLRLANSYFIDSPQPSNISYLWNFGSLLGLCLVLQILTGIFLAMHYAPSVDLAFNSVEHIMRDVNSGWLIRYTHANVASFFFIFVYAHIGRALYYGSYKSPRVLPYSIGVIILILMMATGFLGYVLPYGQMSFWGATVITNLLSAIPIFGHDLVELIWGGFSVSNATLNRFFSLHYLLPFILAALVLMHLLTLHEHGSSNPLGINANEDRSPFHPYFSFKDLVTVFLFFLVLSVIVCFYPNLLGHSDNYIPANPMSTPASIVPEWYLLAFYAILRSIPNKLLGVIAMFGSLLILLILPLTDLSRLRGSQFRPLNKLLFWSFAFNFMILTWIGSCHPESPYSEIGQFSTAFYFAWFLILVPLTGIIENSLADLALKDNLPEGGNKEKFFYLFNESKPSLRDQSGVLSINHLNVVRNLSSKLLIAFSIFSVFGNADLAELDQIEEEIQELADALTDQLDNDSTISEEFREDIRGTIRDLNRQEEEIQEQKAQYPENTLPEDTYKS